MNNLKNRLPDWFNLEKYNELSTITALDFIEQLELRSLLFLLSKDISVHLDTPATTEEAYTLVLFKEWYDSLSNGVVVIISSDEKNTILHSLPESLNSSYEWERESDRELFLKLNPILPQLSESDSILPVSFLTLKTFDNTAKKSGIYQDKNSELVNPGFELGSVSLHKSMNNPAKYEILTTIDIHSYTDHEILNDLKYLLQKWRRETNQQEPKRITGIGPSDFKTLIDYKVIPMFDLLIWGQVNNKKITDEMLSRVLFPDFIHDECTSEMIRKTRKPFAMKYTNRLIFLSHKDYIYQNEFNDWSIKAIAALNLKK